MRISKELLVKFSRDECTSEEIKAIRAWLNDGSFPVLPRGEEISDEIRQRVWTKLHDRIQNHSAGFKRTRIRRSNIVRAAAVALVVIGTAAFIYFNHYSEQPARPITYSTGSNEHRKVILPDSSVVFLSPRSSIDVTQPFAKNKREIRLVGQAVFEVAQNASSPFTVITGDISTTALGTSFKVTSFPGKDKIKIVLSYGKIVVKDRDSNRGRKSSIFLKPGDEIVYDKATQIMHKTEASSGQFDYKNNILYFRNAGIKEVVEKIERYYHIKVQYSELDPTNWRVSGEFDCQPLQTVMQTIAYSCNIRYTIKGDVLILLPNL